MNQKEKTFSLKDQLFNKEKITILSQRISKVFKEFQSNNFYTDVISKFPELELKERIFHINESI